VFWEIGVGEGGSLQMWKAYLGPQAQIVGLDIVPEKREFEEQQIAIRIGSQADENFLASIIEEFGVPDVIIDDGSHQVDDVRATFRYLYPRMSPVGTYMVEDAYTAYWPKTGGGLHKEGTIIEISKGLIDELNAELSRGAVEPTSFTSTTLSMHFYPSIVVFERGPSRPKLAQRIPKVAPTRVRRYVRKVKKYLRKMRGRQPIPPSPSP
jgi:hypothetical protein